MNKTRIFIGFPDNRKILTVTEVKDLVTGKTYAKYEGDTCEYKHLVCELEEVTKKIPSKKIFCKGGIVKGKCCYPKEAESNCSVLIEQAS